MRVPGSRRTRIAGAVVVTLGLVGAFGFGPLVRGRVAREAERRGLLVTVGSVRPGWFSVELRDVRVQPEGVDAVSAQIGALRVELAGLSPKAAVATGVAAELAGTPEALDDALSAWRSRHSAATTDAPSGHTMPISIEQATLHWKLDADDAESVRVSGASATRDDDGWRFSSETLDLVGPTASVHLGTAAASFDPQKHLVSAHAAAFDVSVTLASEAPPPETPPPPPSPPARGAPPEPFRPLLALPDLHKLRARAQSLADLAALHTATDAHADIDSLTLTLVRGKESLSLGPGRARMARGETGFDLSFTAGDTGGKGAPFSLHATLPSRAGDDLVASLSGGPVTLSMLGAREGAMGLEHVDRSQLGGHGRVVLDGQGQALTFDVDASLRQLSLLEPRISKEPIVGLDLSASARGVLDDHGVLRLDDADVALSALHVRGHGTLEQADGYFAGALSLEVPAASCQSILDSIPAALVPHLARARYRGTLAATAHAEFDSRKLDDLVLRYVIQDGCRVTAVPEELQKSHFTGPFEHEIVDKKGDAQTVTTGPNTELWTDLDDISPFMQVAVLTTEDGSFYHHHGFNEHAIRASLIANLKAHKFVRGASTITMQLAKNLFLSREKTLSRKLEEIALAAYLEDEFTKQEMMELYLNLIEFGPDVYGVTAAADHYFGRRPGELNLAESMFLATLLPSPIDLHKKLYEKGDLPDYWLKKIHTLMQVAQKNGRISDKELEEGLSEKVVFHHEGEPRPEPRPILGGGAHPDGRDDGWDTP